MNWLLKAALQKGISLLPAPDRANYVFQRHVTRTLPIGDAGVRRKFHRSLAHLRAFAEHAPGQAGKGSIFYEFGAGWDLAIPLSYASLGVGRQVLVDIRPNLRLELVNMTVASLVRQRDELAEEAGREVADLGPPDLTSAAELEQRLGIVYLAPRDARATGLAEGSIDFISSTNTLEHVPTRDLLSILVECRRLLAPDGLMSFRIDMQDHWSYADPRLSPYNFLRYSERTWRVLNSALSYQNRLRCSDYLRLFEEAGLEVMANEVTRPSEAELVALTRVEVAPEFRRYAPEDLAARALSVVVRTAPGRTSPDGAKERAHVGGGSGSRVRSRAGA